MLGAAYIESIINNPLVLLCILSQLFWFEVNYLQVYKFIHTSMSLFLKFSSWLRPAFSVQFDAGVITDCSKIVYA